MVSLAELNPKKHLLTPEQAKNQGGLHVRINLVRAAYGAPMLVTIGVRSAEEHAAIYAKKSQKAPKGSQHLLGAAVDIADPKGALATWCLANVASLKTWGLYIEDPSCTKGWVHFQIYPPASGNTVFIPFVRKAKK